MKCIEESKIDWYNTRAGRTVVRPQVGDKITFNDVVGFKPKKARTRKQRRAHLQWGAGTSGKVEYSTKLGPKSNSLITASRDPFRGCAVGTHWIK